MHDAGTQAMSWLLHATTCFRFVDRRMHLADQTAPQCSFEFQNHADCIKQINFTLLQVPLTQYRAGPQSPAAAMLYTGEDQVVSTALANKLFVQNNLTSAGTAVPIANFQSQAAQVIHTLHC